MIFYALVHKDEDSAFGVTFPDVPGCYSAADEADQIIPNAIEALSLHLEGSKIPNPKGIDEIRAEAASELSEGAVLLAVPLVRMSGRSVRANITMDAGLLSVIDETAKSRKLTRSAFLADLARKEIGIS